LPEVYSDHFQNRAEASRYETGEYAAKSYSSLLWEIEQSQLAAIIEELRPSHERIEALDFASGTGRVTAFLERRVDSVTGIEISEQMCELARKKVERAKIHCTNILSPTATVEAKYDLITAFRFFLNVEPSLRLAALRALASRLRDSESRLVFNNHGNLWSHKLLLWPYHALRQIGKGQQTAGNYLTASHLLRLLPKVGLQLVSVQGCGLYGAKILRLMSYERSLRAEQRSLGGIFGRLCVNQMYVVKLAQ
jgi:SAM-dependent methyltransferase